MEAKIHLWEIYEIILRAENKYENYYTDVIVWVDLKGPGFDKRVFGFWDGGNVFKVRVTATKPGLWTYTSGASVDDRGLCGKTGAYVAYDWTEEEKQENPVRRGIIRASENGHALQYADGTPFVMVGDTWWGLATYRYPWVDDEDERPIGPGMSMKDMARHRRRQGYNTIGLIAAFPTWADDGRPATILLEDEHRTCLRAAWAKGDLLSILIGKAPAKNMHNEGGRAFLFPGRVPGYEDVVPDFDRINPEYFKVLDRKINWLNANGFTVFIEALRRDCSKVLKYYYDWPMVYTRYIQYLFARYQANNCLFSPIHYDSKINTIDSREFNEPINLFIDIFGAPPFGTLLGTNSPLSSKIAYGGPDEQHWKTFDQLGNMREHEYYWLITDMFNDKSPCPVINGEPYYPGLVLSGHKKDDDGNFTEFTGIEDVTSEDDQLNARSAYFGSVLSGAYGGILAGFDGMWNGNVEEEELPYKIWDTMNFDITYQVRYFRDFLLSEGNRYLDLIPNSELVSPNKSGERYGWRGWAYCSSTQNRDLILGYAEKDCPRLTVRALRPYDIYEFVWFNPRTGEWLNDQKTELEADYFGSIVLPKYPDNLDWAFKLKRLNKEPRINNSRTLDEDLKKVKEEFIKRQLEKKKGSGGETESKK